jgi:hypothetical protein
LRSSRALKSTSKIPNRSLRAPARSVGGEFRSDCGGVREVYYSRSAAGRLRTADARAIQAGKSLPINILA